MSTDEAKIHVTAEEGKEVILSSGFEKKPLKTIHISGNIDSPKEFYQKRKGWVDFLMNKTHLLVDVQKAFLSLKVDETNPYDSYQVDGKMLDFQDFLAFKINTGHQFGKEDFITLLKRNKYYFADKSQHESLVFTFNKFITKVTKDFENSDDQKGNKVKLEAYSALIQGYGGDGSKIDFNPLFLLEIPLFVGQKAVQFQVQICLNPVNTGLSFYLEAPDLYEVALKAKELAITEAIEPFVKDFAVIYV
jgi:hypothetical protein